LAADARVEIRHVRGASDATYLINAFGEELLMQPAAQFTGSSSFIACRHSMRSMPAPLLYVSNAGASAPSMPDGNSAGAIAHCRRSGRRFVKHILLCLCHSGIFAFSPRRAGFQV
jgi:hypothetical protein